MHLGFAMENVLIFIMGSICGISIYRGLVVLMGVGNGVLMFRQAEYMCLQILAASLEDAAYLKATKQNLIETNVENVRLKILLSDIYQGLGLNDEAANFLKSLNDNGIALIGENEPYEKATIYQKEEELKIIKTINGGSKIAF